MLRLSNCLCAHDYTCHEHAWGTVLGSGRAHCIATQGHVWRHAWGRLQAVQSLSTGCAIHTAHGTTTRGALPPRADRHPVRAPTLQPAIALTGSFTFSSASTLLSMACAGTVPGCIAASLMVESRLSTSVAAGMGRGH